MLAAISLLLGTAAVVRSNASQTLLPSVVSRNDLERANGQMWSATQVIGGFAGPPLAGALITTGIVVPFGFTAATLALTFGMIWLITLPARAPSAHKPFWPALREGFGWMGKNPAIVRLAVMLEAINAVSAADSRGARFSDALKAAADEWWSAHGRLPHWLSNSKCQPPRKMTAQPREQKNWAIVLPAR